jgi:hypothetical protein
MATTLYQLITRLPYLKKKKYNIYNMCGTKLVKLPSFVIGREQFLFFIE